MTPEQVIMALALTIAQQQAAINDLQSQRAQLLDEVKRLAAELEGQQTG